MRPSARLPPGLPPRLAGSKCLGGPAAGAGCLWLGTEPPASSSPQGVALGLLAQGSHRYPVAPRHAARLVFF